MADKSAIEKIVLLMVSGCSEADLRTICIHKLAVPKKDVPGLLKLARQQIARAAKFSADHEFGRALVRLNDCYARAIKAQDIRTALGVQRELNKLTGLYEALR